MINKTKLDDLKKIYGKKLFYLEVEDAPDGFIAFVRPGGDNSDKFDLFIEQQAKQDGSHTEALKALTKAYTVHPTGEHLESLLSDFAGLSSRVGGQIVLAAQARKTEDAKKA